MCFVLIFVERNNLTEFFVTYTLARLRELRNPNQNKSTHVKNLNFDKKSREMELIKDGDVVVLQRHNYMRAQKLNAAKNCFVQLARDNIELLNIIGHPYGSAFKMVPHETKKKLWKVELTSEITDFETLFLGENEPSGEDNRNITDSKNSAQGLKRDQIEAMKEEQMDGKEIVGQLIENSASFHQKTKFSQAKFLKKKAQKYFQYLIIKKPSIRLLMQINYKNDPMKMMNLRIDTLAQILNNSNVRSGGKYLVYETGCQGMIVASVLERLGNAGKLVHIYQTGSPQTQSLSAMNFGDDVDKTNLMHTINMYHLRALEQGKDITHMHGKSTENTEDSKKPVVPFRQKQREESIKTYDLIKSRQMDGLIIACKQHPTNTLLALIKYLAYSRPFVVYSPYKEPLMDAYVAIKDTGKTVMVTLTETWLRNYQVLPSRSHPEVLMSGIEIELVFFIM